MTLIVYARDLLRPQSQRVSGQARAILGPQSLAGTTQAIETTAGGRWLVTLSGIPLHAVAAIRAYRALLAKAQGPLRPIEVPIYDRAKVRGGVATVTPYGDQQPHSDQTKFGTGAVSAKLAAAALLRATTIDIDIAGEVALYGGEYLTLRHSGLVGPRLHVIHNVEDLGGGSWRVAIEPPLRAPAATGTDIVFDRLACTMRLLGEGGGLTQAGSFEQYEELSFEEYFA